MHHPMKRPIESGLTAFWLNVETEACTTSNGHTVLPAARAGCAGWYGHSSSRITHNYQLCEVMKLLFESSWSYLAHVHGCWGRRGLNIFFFSQSTKLLLTCRIHEGSYAEDVTDGVRRRPGPGYAHMPGRHWYSGRAAHFGRHGVGVGVRVYVVVGEAGLRGGLLTALILVGLRQISNLVA